MKRKVVFITLVVIYCSLLNIKHSTAQPICITGLKVVVAKTMGTAYPNPFLSVQYPYMVSLGKTYTISGDDGLSYSCAYAGETSLNSVRGGFVNDENDTQ